MVVANYSLVQPPAKMAADEYLLGTDDKELERLLLQHELWKPETETLFSLSGFQSGQTLLDLGQREGRVSRTAAEVEQRLSRSKAGEVEKRLRLRLPYLMLQLETFALLVVRAEEVF